jgi:hypothetical protein
MRSTGSVLRWGTGLQTSETGANAGSDFRIWNYADNGGYLSEALAITRANNKTTIAGPVTLSTVNDNTNGNLTSGTFANTMTIKKSDGTASAHTVASVGSIRYLRIGSIVNIKGAFRVTYSGAFAFYVNTTLPVAPNNFSNTTSCQGICTIAVCGGGLSYSVVAIQSENGAKTIRMSPSLSTFTSGTTDTFYFDISYDIV